MDLTCPYCGHLQQESAAAVSSFCRQCSEHFRIRKGVAIANPGLKVSGIAEVKPARRRRVDPEAPAPEPAKGDAWLVSAESPDATPFPLIHAPRSAEPEDGISAGAFFGLSGDAAEADETSAAGSSSIGSQSMNRGALGEGSMAALMGSHQPIIVAGKEKMPPNYVAPEDRRRRDEPVPEMPVRCYRCYHVQGVSRFAKSTQCERCNVYISLASYDIRNVKCHTLRTRGNVTIGRRGGLINNSEIACHHLVVHGAIDATVDCSGDATFRHSGTVRGSLYCEKLVIEKGCELRFPDGVMARRAEISGHLIGNLTCSGKVRLNRTAIIEGDLKTAELEARDGSRVSGATDVDPETTTELPLRKGFNPSVIG